MIDNFYLNKIKKELLEEHYFKIVNKINKFYEEKRGFILTDLFEENYKKNDYYYKYMTKGFLLVFLDFEFIKIIATYNGKKNFVYMPIKRIK